MHYIHVLIYVYFKLAFQNVLSLLRYETYSKIHAHFVVCTKYIGDIQYQIKKYDSGHVHLIKIQIIIK